MLLDDDLGSDVGRFDDAPNDARAASTRSVVESSTDGTMLFDAHVALAERLARRYGFGTRVDDDLRQVALLGLHLATQRFDPDRGRFVSFASVTIDGELKKHLRDTGWGVRVPRSRQEDVLTVTAADERLTARLGRAPTIDEIAEHTGFERVRVSEARRARRARFTDPLDGVDAPPVRSTSPEDAAILSATLEQLETTQRRLIRLRYSEGLDRRTIAQRVGMSCSQVDRRIKRALSALRRQLDDGGAASEPEDVLGDRRG